MAVQFLAPLPQCLSADLSDAGIENWVLNALNDAEEAQIVALAGRAGRVTVATNMAGRGTDIRIDEDVAKVGGLAIILTELHDAGRIDRQFAGRSGRQGDPGSVEAVLSLEDNLVTTSGQGPSWAFATRMLPVPVIGRHFALGVFRRAQRKLEARHARIRYACLEADRRLTDLLAFAGDPE